MTLGIVQDAPREAELAYSKYKGEHHALECKFLSLTEVC